MAWPQAALAVHPYGGRQLRIAMHDCRGLLVSLLARPHNLLTLLPFSVALGVGSVSGVVMKSSLGLLSMLIFIMLLFTLLEVRYGQGQAVACPVLPLSARRRFLVEMGVAVLLMVSYLSLGTLVFLLIDRFGRWRGSLPELIKFVAGPLSAALLVALAATLSLAWLSVRLLRLYKRLPRPWWRAAGGSVVLWRQAARPDRQLRSDFRRGLLQSGLPIMTIGILCHLMYVLVGALHAWLSPEEMIGVVQLLSGILALFPYLMIWVLPVVPPFLPT